MKKRFEDKKAKMMFDLYKKGFSLEQVGNAFGTTRQAVYGLFKTRGLNLRKRTKLPFIMFNGSKYTIRNNGYYGKTNDGRTLLHRDIWEKSNGIIPEGFDIHHIDGNKQNNKIENLELIRKDIHAKKFSTGRNQNTNKTHCIHGHFFDEKNTYYWNGHRVCRHCSKIRARKYHKAKMQLRTNNAAAGPGKK